MYTHFKPSQVIIIYAGFNVVNLLTIRQPAIHETETQLSHSLYNANFPLDRLHSIRAKSQR